MNWNRIAMVANIIKALSPVIFKLVDDVISARNENSEGGRKITKSERQEIIMDHVIDFPLVIELIIAEMEKK